LLCNQIGNHPENNLAKFGCIVNMKVKKKNRIPLGYLLEIMIKTLAIWNLKKIEVWRLCAIFSHEKYFA